ncbi:MAG: thiol-disulfide isomerase [Bryobacteraceae bacterium]
MKLPAAMLLAACAYAASVPTFSKDIYPILRSRCQGCHQKGEVAPMAFITYQDARPWAKAIKTAVLRGTMPPWHADPASSAAFHNDRSLAPEQVRTIAAWVDAGAPEGPHIDYPQPHRAVTGWRLGKPDLILKVPGFRVPPQGTIPYTFVAFPTGFERDTWIRAAEWRIDKRQVVHHMNAFVRPPGSSYVAGFEPRQFFVPTLPQRRVGRPGEGTFARRELLVGYEPGYIPTDWGPEQGKLIKAGSDIVFEMHYNSAGKEAVDESELGIYFSQQPPERRLVNITVQNLDFVIPPGEASYRSDASTAFSAPVRVVSVQPHMHLRGKSMEMKVVQPDGKSEALIRVPNYDFHWQTTYDLKHQVAVQPGGRIDCAAWFDNSANNKWNPDPGKSIVWGDQSWDEMHIGFTEIAFDANLDPEKIVTPVKK